MAAPGPKIERSTAMLPDDLNDSRTYVPTVHLEVSKIAPSYDPL